MRHSTQIAVFAALLSALAALPAAAQDRNRTLWGSGDAGLNALARMSVAEPSTAPGGRVVLTVSGEVGQDSIAFALWHLGQGERGDGAARFAAD